MHFLWYSSSAWLFEFFEKIIKLLKLEFLPGNERQIESETDSTDSLEGTGIGLTPFSSIDLLKELSAASEIEMQNLKKELLTESEKLSQQHNPGIILLNTVTYESAKQFRDQVKKLPKSWGHLS